MLQDKNDALDLLRGLAGSTVTGFRQYLEDQGYAGSTVVERVRAAAHLERWIERSGLKLKETTEATLKSFGRHLPGCRCSGAKSMWRKAAMKGARLFLEYLRRERLVPPGPRSETALRPSPLLAAFRNWMFQHRGVKTRTLDQYSLILDDLLHTLGEPARFHTHTLRQFVLERGERCGRG